MRAELVLEVQEPRPTPAAEECEEGRHTPHPLWAWRCQRCLALLCLTCGEELEECREGGSHGR